MGYMGFGMRKEVYTRKPRQPFKKQRERFKKELGRWSIQSGQSKSSISKAEIEKIKQKIRSDLREQVIKEWILSLIILGVTILILIYILG